MVLMVSTTTLTHFANGKEKVCFVCECGIKIFGNSIKNAEANLKIHTKSKRHKGIMEFKKESKK